MCGILFIIEELCSTMTGNQQETDKIQDIRKFEFYRILGKGCKAMQDGRISIIEDVREKLRQQRVHRNVHLKYTFAGGCKDLSDQQIRIIKC